MPNRAATDFIYELEIHGIKLGLEKIRLLLEALGSPQRRYPCVLVAGTNGKGSVTAMLTEVLTRAGYRCGRYTSPHLVRFDERICLNDRPISKSALETAAVRARDAIRKLLASGAFEAPCTFFDATTAMALDYFARAAVDVAILEVGMGGRFDATNAVEPVLSIITNIDLDHEHYLGSTRPAIAREKVGIARAGRTLVMGPTGEQARSAIRAGCEKRGAVLVEAAGQVHAEWLQPASGAAAAARSTRSAQRLRGKPADELVRFHGERGEYGPLQLSLAGQHQIDNALTAIAALEELEGLGFKLGRAAVESGLSGVLWPGRLQELAGEPLLILDGAHNPAGARALASYLSSRRFPELTLVFGAMQDKSVRRMAEELFPVADRIFLTRPPSRRAADPEDLRSRLTELHPALSVVDEPARAAEAALAITSRRGAVCVCGSLYLVGAILEQHRLLAHHAQVRRPLPARAAALLSRAARAARPRRVLRAFPAAAR